MSSKYILVLIFCFCQTLSFAQKTPEKVQKPENWLEGFGLSKDSIKFQQSYLYAPCPDWLAVDQPRLWQTALVSRVWESNFATFFFLAKISHEVVAYQVKINGESLIEFSATSLPEWVMRGEKEASLEFTAIEEQGKSNLGYLRLIVPMDFVRKNERQTIEITPSQPTPALWISACPNNLAHFISRNEEEFWYELALQTSPDSIQSLSIEVPAAWVGKRATYKFQTQKDVLHLQKREHEAISSFYLYGTPQELAKQKLDLQIEGQKRKAVFDLLENQDNTQIVGNLLVKQKSRLSRTGLWRSRVEGVFCPELQNFWQNMTNNALKNGSVQIATLDKEKMASIEIPTDWQPETMIRNWLNTPPQTNFLYISKPYRHGLQSSQFFKKAGFKFLISPFTQNQIFRWASPDGSLLDVWALPTRYESPFWQSQDANVQDFPLFYLGSYAQVWQSQNPTFKKILPVLSSQPIKWATIRAEETILPPIEEKNAEEILENYVKNNPEIPTFQGENAELNPNLRDMNPIEMLEKRQLQRALLEAEKWWALGTCRNAFLEYPEAEIDKFWTMYSQNSKGLSRKEVEIFGKNALKHLASQIKTQNSVGTPMIVFNGLAWERSETATVNLEFSPTETVKGFKVVDQEGKEVAYQVSEIVKHQNGNLKHAQLHFWAENVPSLGYKTYYLRSTEKLEEGDLRKPKNRQYDIEAGSYKVQLSNGGIQQIMDLELNTQLLSSQSFLANEIWIGNQEKTEIQFRKNALTWKLLEDGQLRTVLETFQQTENGDLQQYIILHKKSKRIDFKTVIKNPKWANADQQFRLAFPLAEGNYTNYYGTTWATFEVGKHEQPTTKKQNLKIGEQFAGAKNGNFGVVIGSDLPLWEFQYQNKPVLQSLLLTYSQQGNFEFNYSLSSFGNDSQKAHQEIRQSQMPLQVLFNPLRGNTLPEKHSFLSTEQPLVLSSLKKAKNERAMILRVYETEGKEINYTLKLGWEVGKAEKTNLLEQDRKAWNLSNATLRLSLGAYSVETLRLE